MTFHIVTLFPDAFRSYLGESILKRAIEDKKIVVKFYNPRDFADNKYKRIDRAPYGGRPGMVIQALPVIKAIEDALETCNAKHVTRRKKVTGYGLRVTGENHLAIPERQSIYEHHRKKIGCRSERAR